LSSFIKNVQDRSLLVYSGVWEILDGKGTFLLIGVILTVLRVIARLGLIYLRVEDSL